MPVVIDEAEWSGLEAAVAQRAALLDAILADVYGRRTLLADGVIPPEVVLAHPAFLRAVDRLTTPGPHGLVLTGTDISRDPSGAWLAVADRTQAPSGAGYAMVDRRVIAQSMAGVYRQTSIRRIGPFFHALRRALDLAAPAGVRQPQAVLLTAGPFSETAFDQAYLASMLGIPLVEGSDLEVREGKVWLQGLEGSEQVDVILRRVDAEWCDPLDLRADSRLGIPGLVRAVRAGTVAVVNPLGSGVLEHPALGAYLPRAARVDPRRGPRARVTGHLVVRRGGGPLARPRAPRQPRPQAHDAPARSGPSSAGRSTRPPASASPRASPPTPCTGRRRSASTAPPRATTAPAPPSCAPSPSGRTAATT